jgi:hypothetical protein
MASYIVTFFKNLVSSEGHPFRTTQDRVEVRSSSPQRAIDVAMERFATARRIRDWTLHADSFDIQTKGRAASGIGGRVDAGTSPRVRRQHGMKR